MNTGPRGERGEGRREGEARRGRGREKGEGERRSKGASAQESPPAACRASEVAADGGRREDAGQKRRNPGPGAVRERAASQPAREAMAG
eukprot:964815-Heterocapsa_arctica.AAC.1